MRKASYAGQVVTNSEYNTVLSFTTATKASLFCAFIAAKYSGLGYATQADNDVLFSTGSKELFAACTAQMDKLGIPRN